MEKKPHGLCGCSNEERELSSPSSLISAASVVQKLHTWKVSIHMAVLRTAACVAWTFFGGEGEVVYVDPTSYTMNCSVYKWLNIF